MKRIISILLLSVLLAGCILPCCTADVSAAGKADSQQTPVIGLSYIPVYGEDACFEGKIFMEDNSSAAEFDPADYRVTMYLQTRENGSYWIKPYGDQTYETIESNGCFCYTYNTGGVDLEAVKLHFFLIPASFTPDSNFTKTRSIALDYVLVTRTPDGSISVSPSGREVALSDRTAVTPLLPVSGDAIALDVGLYLDGERPGYTLSTSQIHSRLAALRPFTDTVRFYSAAGEVAKAYPIAKRMGFKIAGSAWLSGSESDDRKEIDGLVDLCNSGYCDMAVVGSETILRGDLTVSRLISYIEEVRTRTGGKIPVTTGDTLQTFQSNRSLCNACDAIFVNYYPYWSKVADSSAAADFIATMEALQKKYPDRTVICSETGTPTAGAAQGNATASPQQAAAYFSAIREWSVKTGTQIFYFEAIDESWKTTDEGEAGGNWGIMDEDLTVKDCYSSLSVFRKAAEKTAFHKSRSYAETFSDISTDAWYAPYVKTAYEYGFMDGKAEGKFDPQGTLTVAQAITVVCKMNAITHGIEIENTVEKHWYDPYIAYGEESGILNGLYFENYDRPVTRGEMAQLLIAAVPALYQEAVITGYLDIPDIDMTESYAASVYSIYRAGIVSGTDAAGNYHPERSLTRAEMAVFITRVADPQQRIVL